LTADKFLTIMVMIVRNHRRRNAWNKVPVDHILSTPGLSDADKIAILGGTAAKLLGIAP
jgi:hypothetical protein